MNAIRTAHNPPAPEFLDLCDRMGLLVMDEFFDCWTVAKNPFDYHVYFKDWSHTDERDSILRDRNHPSIILYSVGNEIHDTPKRRKQLAGTILKGLVEVAHETDPHSPRDAGIVPPNVSHDYDDGLADMLDVVGQNYRENEILAAHRQNPARKIIGTENTHDRNAWLALRDNPPYAGQFLWSGIDYLGESAPAGRSSPAGLRPARPHRRAQADGRRTPKLVEQRAHGLYPAPHFPHSPFADRSRLRTRATKRPAPPARFVSRLDPAAIRSPTTKTWEIYSNCGEVELFLNGKSLGKECGTLNADASVAELAPCPMHPAKSKLVARNEKWQNSRNRCI